MSDIRLMKELSRKTESRIVMLVMDGLGGIAVRGRNKTELEAAVTPNLDKLAAESACGLIRPVSYGITPGSGPAHFALFGYDPLEETFDIGRGVLEVLGLGLKVEPGEIAARGNFATAGDDGRILDRRAGRISTERCAELCGMIEDGLEPVKGIDIRVHPAREHRFALILSGEGLNADVTDTDPQKTGAFPLDPEPVTEEGEKTAALVTRAIGNINEIIAGEPDANTILLRGFSSLPSIPSMRGIFNLNPAGIAGYPLYRGVARAAGMDILETGSSPEEEMDVLETHFDKYDFFFIHVKKTDSYGEDGNFDAKVSVIEETDRLIPRLTDLTPDVIVVTGDHATPSDMKLHSWHPVPIMIWSDRCGPDNVTEFGERACLKGGLGRFPAKYIMELAMANAGKLKKFGA